MPRTYYTADTHIGHAMVAGLRGFENPDDHDEHLREVWNNSVRPTDIVWILGDLTLRNPSRLIEYMNSLHGVKNLILGNHDAGHPMHRNWQNRQGVYGQMFNSISPSGTTRLPGLRAQILLSHFPYGEQDHTPDARFVQWRLPDEGRWLLHGHTHSDVRYDFERWPRQIHVGWDAWGRPVESSELTAIIREEDDDFH